MRRPVGTRLDRHGFEVGLKDGGRRERHVSGDRRQAKRYNPAFLTHIVDKKPMNMAFDAADSTLTAILGRMDVDLRREVTWDELLKSE